MREPRTTDQIVDIYKDSIKPARQTVIEFAENSTCSAKCKHCDERVWFTGSWEQNLEFDCPYCGKKGKLS